MAPKPTVTVLDQFEVYHELVRRSRRSFIMSGAMLVVTLLALCLAFLSFTRPLPVVVTSDNPLEPRKIVTAGDTSVREIDAKRFLAKNAERLHGFSSLNVVSELSDASLVMTSRWRKRFLEEVNAPVAVPESIDPSGTTSLLQSYVLAKLRNELVLDWDTASCARSGSGGADRGSSGSGAWHCKLDATMKLLPLLGDGGREQAVSKRLAIRATLVEVPVTVSTVDGLLVDFWDAAPIR